jgi:hypothetical protein
MNAKLGKQIWTGIAVTTCELHEEVNDNVSVRGNNTQVTCRPAHGLCHNQHPTRQPIRNHLILTNDRFSYCDQSQGILQH